MCIQLPKLHFEHKGGHSYAAYSTPYPRTHTHTHTQTKPKQKKVKCPTNIIESKVIILSHL